VTKRITPLSLALASIFLAVFVVRGTSTSLTSSPGAPRPCRSACVASHALSTVVDNATSTPDALPVASATPAPSASAYASATPPTATPPTTVTEGYVYGGGLADLHPSPLTAAQLAALPTKIAAQFAVPLPTALPINGTIPITTVGANVVRPRDAAAGGWYYASNFEQVAEPLGNASSYPYCYTDQAQTGVPPTHSPCAQHDPYFYGNLCGPGSSTEIVHSLAPSYVDGYNVSPYNQSVGRGANAYLNYAAYRELNYTFDPRFNVNSWGTEWSIERDFLNGEIDSQGIGVQYYVSDPCDTQNLNCATTANQGAAPYGALTEANFELHLHTDIVHGPRSYPLMATVDAAGLSYQDWGGAPADHFVAVDGYNPTRGLVEYIETANDTLPSGYGVARTTPGRYTMMENQFYAKAIEGGRNDKYAERMVLW